MSTTLFSDVDEITTALPAAIGNLNDDVPPFLAQIGQEYLWVKGRTLAPPRWHVTPHYLLLVERGFLGSSPESHDQGDTVRRVVGQVQRSAPAAPPVSVGDTGEGSGSVQIAEDSPQALSEARAILSSNNADGGYLTLLIDGIETGHIAFDASSDDIRDAIVATDPARLAGTVTVSDH